MTTNNWNTPVSTLFLLAFSLSSFNSLAAESANFKIKGRFLPTTCNISLSQNELNLGDIHYGSLEKKRSGARLAGRLLTKDVGVYNNAPLTKLTVTCDSIASAGFFVIDNYKSYSPWNLLGTNIDGEDLSNSFGLKPLSGMTKDGKLGGYFFEFTKANSKDPFAADKDKLFNAPLESSKLSAAAWIKKKLVGRSDLSQYWTSNNKVDKSNHFEVDFKPNLFFFYDSTQRNMDDEITFEGSSTFTVFYI